MVSFVFERGKTKKCDSIFFYDILLWSPTENGTKIGLNFFFHFLRWLWQKSKFPFWFLQLAFCPDFFVTPFAFFRSIVTFICTIFVWSGPKKRRIGDFFRVPKFHLPMRIHKDSKQYKKYQKSFRYGFCQPWDWVKRICSLGLCERRDNVSMNLNEFWLNGKHSRLDQQLINCQIQRSHKETTKN